MDQTTQIADRNKFRFGMLLAWMPLLFFIIPSAIGFFVSINNHPHRNGISPTHNTAIKMNLCFRVPSPFTQT
jgi:hypothetical protein